MFDFLLFHPQDALEIKMSHFPHVIYNTTQYTMQLRQPHTGISKNAVKSMDKELFSHISSL